MGDHTAVQELEHVLRGAERQVQLLHQAELAAVAASESAVAQVHAAACHPCSRRGCEPCLSPQL